MGSMGFFLGVFRNPVEGVIFILSTGLFGYAMYLLSPWYLAAYPSPVGQSVSGPAEVALGIFYILSSLPGMLAPTMKNREGALKLGTFGIFASFLFLFILRVVVFGWVPLTWLPSAMISLVSAYLYVWLKVRKE